MAGSTPSSTTLGGLQARTGFLDITDEQWLATFNLNFHAARRMSRAAVPAMLAGGGGDRPRSTSAATPRGCRKSATSTTRRPNFRCWHCPPHLATEFSPKASGRTSWSPDPTRTPLYGDRPGGFGDQAAEAVGAQNKEAAIPPAW